VFYVPLNHISSPVNSTPEPELICDDCNNEIEYDDNRVT
jgi:hypothetical protein